MTAVSIADARYLHLGADPVAKQLYASLIAALHSAQEADAALRQYLDAR